MADTTEKPHGAPNTVDRVYRWMRPHSRRGRSAPVAQDGSAEDGGFFFFFFFIHYSHEQKMAVWR